MSGDAASGRLDPFSIAADELTERTAKVVGMTDVGTPCFGVLGIDGADRVVFYDDDGCVVRYPIEDGDVAERGHPEYSRDFLGPSPHDGEGAILALDTGGWNWIHPRYRWLTEP